MSKRASITKLCDLDPESSQTLTNLSERSIGHGLEDSICSTSQTPSKPAKSPKKRPSQAAAASNNRENTNSTAAYIMSPTQTSSSSRRRKSYSTENVVLTRNGSEMTSYVSPYHTEASLNYCAQNPYSTAIFLPTGDQCSLLPYSSQYGGAAGFYSAAAALPVSSESVLAASNGAALLDRSYDLYAAAAYGSDVLPSQGLFCLSGRWTVCLTDCLAGWLSSWTDA